MRSCIGTILLVILITFIGITALYLWESNNRIEFSVRDDEEPESSETSRPMKDLLPKKDETPPAVEKGVMVMEVPAPPTPEDAPASTENNAEAAPAAPVEEEIPLAEPVE